MPKTIGFTYDLRSDYPLKDGEPGDLNAEFDKPDTIGLIKSAIESAGHKVIPIGNVRNLLKMLPDLKNQVDLVFNICEGIGSRNREAQLPIILEAFGIPCVGSDGLTMSLTLDKIMAKKIFIAEGIPTPKYIGIDKPSDIINLDHLNFPMIVKMRQEGTSKGLSDDSVVYNNEQLEKKARSLFDRYNNPPLMAEELILGAEFTVPIIGNSPVEVFPAVQISIYGKLDLGDMIYTFARVTSNDVEYICPPQISNDLEKKISDLALRAYMAVGCLDFGRVDMRVDKNDNPYVLEINPLPSLLMEDAFGISPKIKGYDYNATINKIINAGLKRYGMTI